MFKETFLWIKTLSNYRNEPFYFLNYLNISPFLSSRNETSILIYNPYKSIVSSL